MQNLMKRKRLYCHSNGECSYCVVAHSVADAKKLLWADDEYDIKSICDDDYMNLDVKWSKQSDVSDLPVGMVDEMVGLKRGIYSGLIDRYCPYCGNLEWLEYHEALDTICCYGCEDWLTELRKEEHHEFCGEMPQPEQGRRM